MTSQELLKPRYKVIADYPNNEFKVGTILDINSCKYEDDDNKGNILWKISDFPHLFKKLQWWEYRKIEDMPDYIKDGTLFLKVKYKDKMYQSTLGKTWHPIYEFSNYILPATEEEFHAQKK